MMKINNSTNRVHNTDGSIPAIMILLLCLQSSCSSALAALIS